MKHLPYLNRISLSSIILAQQSNTEIRSKWGKYQVAKKAILVSLLFLSIGSKAQQPELVIPIGHTGYISSLEFSPDGQYLLTTAEAGVEVAKIWNLSGQEVATLKNKIGCAMMGKFSPDGKYIITACDTGFFQVWDRKTKTLIATETIGDNLIFAVGFSPDGTLAEVSYEGGTEQYKILNSELERVGEKLSYFDGKFSRPTYISYSKDGQLILTHSYEAPSATLRKADGAKLLTLPDSIFSSDISPDNKYIITAGRDGLIKHWTIDGQLLNSFELEDEYNSIEFSPNGKYLLTRDKFFTYFSYPERIYNLQGEPIPALNKYEKIAISPDAKTVAAISSTGELLILDINGKIIRNISKKISEPIQSVSFTLDGKKLLSRSGNLPTNKVWDLNTMTVQPIKMFLPTVFSPDNSRSLTLGKDNTAVIRDAKGWPIQVLKGHNAPVTSLAFSPSNANDPVGGKLILTASADSTAKLWNLQGQEIHSFQWEPQLHGAKNGGAEPATFSATFSNDGESIFMRNHTNYQLQEWDLATVDQRILPPSPTLVYPTIKEEPILSLYQNLGISTANGAIVDEVLTNLTPIPVPKKTGFPMAFAPDGPEIMKATPNYKVALLDPTDETKLDRFASRISWSNRIAFSADGTKIVSATHPKYHVRLWSRDGQLLQSLQGHKGMIHSVTFSPDGQHILTASADRSARMWNMMGKKVARFKGHSGEVTTAAFFPDGTKVVTAGQDGMAIIWNLKGEVIKRIPVWEEGGIDALAIAPNGKEFVVGQDGNEHNLKIIALNGTILDSFTSANNYISKLHFSDWDGAQHVIAIGKKYYEDDLNIIELYNRKGHLVQTLKKYDTTFRPLAFSPDGQHIITANITNSNPVLSWSDEFLLLSTDTLQGPIWKLSAPNRLLLEGHTNTINDVTFSPEGKWLATAGEDHVIKIWDRKTGEELVTLFAVDSTDWVVTSPSGLFDASPSAMYRLYYVVSEEIIELEQLKSRYYEPGLLQKLLGLSDERIRPVEAFDTLRLYPTVQAEIIQDTLHIKLRARNGGIGKASLFINGKEVVEEVNPLPRGKGTKRDSIIHYHLQQHQSYLFRHPDSTNIISIRAYNEEGWLKSKAITLTYKWSGARSRGSSSTAEENAWVGQLRPKLYVVSIGTSDYTGTQLDLEYADQDATMMAKALQSVGAALFTNGDSLEVYCLSTASVDSTGFQGSTVQWEFAQKDNIKATFDKIKRKAKAEDVIVVYLSGHGVTQGGTDQTQFYYLTQGVASEDDLADPATLKAYTISTEELTKWINDIPALKQVLIIDACNSGQIVENVTGGTKALNSSQVRALDRMKDRTGMFLLSGSASNKVSYEAGQYGQGLLTYALLQGMRGVAVRKDTEGKEVVDVMTLFQYARDEVPRLAASINGIQTPMLGFPGRSASFDIGLLDKEAKATIPIGNKKPVMIRSNFLNEITYSDDLQLVQRLEKAFRKESAKGARANLIYVDVNEYPNAYALRGFYKIKGENIEVRLKLFRGKESFDLDIPLVNSAEELVGEIRWLVQEKIAELEEE